MPKKEPISSENTDTKRKRQLPERLRSMELSTPGHQKSKKRTTEESASMRGGTFFSTHPIRYSKKDLDNLGVQNFDAKNYIPSALDRTDLVTVQPVALLVESQGQGLFAKKEIPEGTCIGIYTGLIYTSEEFQEYLDQNPGADKNYAMSVGGDWVDAAQKGNFTRYMNFSDTQYNVAFVKGKNNHKTVVKVIALKNIPQGHQILVDYNTYEPNASQHYFFMNPEDNETDSYAIYEAHKTRYKMMRVRKTISPLRLVVGQDIVLTKIAECVLKNISLKVSSRLFNPADADLPCFLVDTDNTLFNFNQADVITPLMIACYYGHQDNVKWLVNAKANIDRQQNHSGNCPLFFALEGYYGATDKSKHFEIIEFLIDNNVNMTVHDREDKIFLHKALPVLSNGHFTSVLAQLSVRDPEDLNALFNFVDHNNEDIVLQCLRIKDFDKFAILLDANPGYFLKNLAPSKKIDIRLFLAIVNDYSEQDRQHLLDLIRTREIQIQPSLLEQISQNLELDSELGSSPSMS